MTGGCQCWEINERAITIEEVREGANKMKAGKVIGKIEFIFIRVLEELWLD